MSKANPNHVTTRLEPCDQEAFSNAAVALQGPQAAFDAIHRLITRRYGLGPMDTVSIDGTINRVKPDEVEA